MRGATACTLAVLACALAGCGDELAQAIGGGAGDAGDAGAAGEASPPRDATTDSDASPDAPAGDGGFCSGHGPVALPGTGLCTGDLAGIFRFAACACTSLEVSGVLATDSFDSTSDAGAAATASIGSNGSVQANSTTTLGGSVWAAGQGLAPGASAVTLQGTSPGVVARDLQSGGPVTIGGPYRVGGSVWADGNVTLASGGSLTVGGIVYLPAGDTAAGVAADGGIVTAAVSVAPPCDCTPHFDIGTIVAGFASGNDDGPLPVTMLDNPTKTVALPCGRYYVDGIHGGPVTLDVSGRVVLAVGGDVSVTGDLTITLEPGAELDLFVAHDVTLTGSNVVIGDTASPARARVYVNGNFTMSASAMVSANLYAPHAILALSSDFTMRGALFAQELQLSGAFTIHYDTSVLQVPGTSGCQPTGGSCSSCNDCSGATPACRGGTCKPCVTDADCCAPLRCARGTGLCVLASQ